MGSFLYQPDWSYSTKSWMTPVELFVLIFFVVFPFFFYASVYFALVYSVVFPWALHVLNLLCYGIPGMILRRGAGAMKLVDMDGLVPGVRI